jgi:hypothetical protein
VEEDSVKRGRKGWRTSPVVLDGYCFVKTVEKNRMREERNPMENYKWRQT